MLKVFGAVGGCPRGAYSFFSAGLCSERDGPGLVLIPALLVFPVRHGCCSDYTGSERTVPTDGTRPSAGRANVAGFGPGLSSQPSLEERQHRGFVWVRSPDLRDSRRTRSARVFTIEPSM